jgi:hypothetical protein
MIKDINILYDRLDDIIFSRVIGVFPLDGNQIGYADRARKRF